MLPRLWHLPSPQNCHQPLLLKLTPPPIPQPKGPAENTAFPMGKKHLWLKKCVQSRCGKHRARWEMQAEIPSAASSFPVPRSRLAGAAAEAGSTWQGLSCSWGMLPGLFPARTDVLRAGLGWAGGAAGSALPPPRGGWMSHKVTSPSSQGLLSAATRQGCVFPTSGQFLLSVSSSSFPLGPSAAARP